MVQYILRQEVLFANHPKRPNPFLFKFDGNTWGYCY